jgi:hypothetical protein
VPGTRPHSIIVAGGPRLVWKSRPGRADVILREREIAMSGSGNVFVGGDQLPIHRFT